MTSKDKPQEVTLPGAPASGGSAETYCPICGKDAADPSLKRFGEYFCSEAHVAEYARESRSKQAAEAGTATMTPLPTETADVAQAPEKKGGISGFLKMAACCGGMLLLFPALGLVSLGGIAAVAGSALFVAAVLACPIGMYLMMRMMMKQGRSGQGQSDGREGRVHRPDDETPSAADR